MSRYQSIRQLSQTDLTILPYFQLAWYFWGLGLDIYYAQSPFRADTKVLTTIKDSVNALESGLAILN